MDPGGDHRAVSAGVDIGAKLGSRSLAVDRNPEADGLAGWTWTKDEMQLAGAEPIGDGAVRLSQIGA